MERSERITPDDYYLLRHSIGARATLMDLTHGEERALTEGTVPEILAVIEERRRDETRAEVAEERALREAAEARELARSQHIRGQAEGIASVAARVITYFTLGVVILGLAWGLIGVAGGEWSDPIRLTFGACALALSVLTFGHIRKGITVEDRVRELEVWFADRVEVWLRGVSGG